jgi:hypothetical protein
MKQNRLFYILRLLHFLDNTNEPDKTDENYDRPWKIRTMSDKLNDIYAKYYSQTIHLAINKIVLFKGRVIFKRYTYTKKDLGFEIKIYKLCGSY